MVFCIAVALLETIEVCGHAKPAILASCISVGVAARSRLPIRLRVPESGVNERELAEDPDTHVERLEIRSRIGPRHPRQECRPVDDSAIDAAAQKILRQVLGVPAHVRLLGGAHIVAVELPQDLEILLPGAILLECGVLHEGLRREQRHPSSASGLAKEPVLIYSLVPDFPWRNGMLLGLRGSGPLYRRVYH